MAVFERNGIKLSYQDSGDGFPVFLLAPGGMNSTSAVWSRFPWNPLDELHEGFRLIGMDQRNAGESSAPVRAEDDWGVYADDHLALLDHLNIDRFHVLGSCIGGSYALRLMQRAPDRVVAAVLQQPIGFDGGNRDAFRTMFDGWAAEVRKQQPAVSPEAWDSFRANMFDGDFVFSVDRSFVRACTIPMLVLMGNDAFHPAEISREVTALAPNAEILEHWKEAGVVRDTVDRVRRFLSQHTPR